MSQFLEGSASWPWVIPVQLGESKEGRERGTKGRRKEEKEGGGRGKGVGKKGEKKIVRLKKEVWAAAYICDSSAHN